MIICTSCGFHNDDQDQFCGGCQEFLEWTGEAVDGDPVVSDVEPDTDEPVGLMDRVVETIRGTRDPDAPAAPTPDSPSAADEDARRDAAVVGEAARKAEEAAAEAERVRQEAADHAREQAELTEQARRAAEEAELARRAAEDHAAAESEAAERLRQEVEAAREAREHAERELAAEAEQTARAREEASRHRESAVSDTERDAAAAAELARERDAAAARLQAEQDELDAVRARLEQAEATRRAAEQQAEAETRAAEQAAEAADQAERTRRDAEARAIEEAAEAERARRAAALVARPRPSETTATTATPTTATPTTATPTAAGGLRKPSARSGSSRRRGRSRPTPESRSTPPDDEGLADHDEPARAAPVKPGRARSRPTARPQVVAEQRLRPGDLVCGECGTGNAPERKFCRSCGHGLEASAVVRRPWWQRVVPRRRPAVAGSRPSRGSRKGAAAGVRGARRGVLGGLGKVGRVVTIVLMAAAALGITLVPDLRDAASERVAGITTSVRRLVAPEFAPVLPITTTASTEVGPDHLAVNATNQTTNLWWAARPRDEQPTLEVTFAEPVDIAAIGVTPGAAETTEYVENPRPRALHLVFDTGATADLEVEDRHEFQSFDVDGASEVTSVVVQVTDVWEGQGGDQLSLANLEFRTIQ